MNVELLERRDAPAFLATATYAAGGNPLGEVNGHFNSDGKMDLAVVNQTAPATISVFLNDTEGFQPKKSYPAGPSANSIATADFNGDGKLDLAVTDPANNTVSVLRGSGTGVFRRPLVFGAGRAPQSVLAADFNNDGKQDLAVANAQHVGEVSVLLGKGNGTFEPFQSYPAGTFARSIAAGDVNNDGRIDLLMAGHEVNCGPYHCPQPDNDRVTVFIGVGNGTFAIGASYDFYSSPGDIVAADFDADGKLDFATVDVFPEHPYTAQNLYSQLGNGDGTFQNPVAYNLGKSPEAVDAGDTDGDGDIDLLVMMSSDIVTHLRNSGSGTFGVTGGFYSDVDPRMVVVANFALGSAADLAIVSASGTVRVVPGLGGGAFASTLPGFSGGKFAQVVTTADLNDDGDPDLITGNAASDNDGTGTMNVMLGKEGSTFKSPQGYYSGWEPSSLTTADFDGDGVTDAAIGNGDFGPDSGSSRVTVIRGIGDGAFQKVRSYVVPINSFELDLADLNGDGFLDLTMPNANHDGMVTVLFGLPGGRFGPPISVVNLSHAMSVVLRDLNADGILDMTVGGYVDGKPDYLAIALGVGDGTFLTPSKYENFNGPFTVIAEDFNRDGIPDVACTNFYDDRVSVLLGNGDGTFGTTSDFAVGLDPRYMVVGDFNQDGNPDLITGNETGTSTISILLGNGDGTFQPYKDFGPSLFVRDLDEGDVNGDGKLDLVVTAHPGLLGVEVFLGNGDGTFQPGTVVPTYSAAYDNTLVDLNSDRNLDMAVSNTGANPSISVHLGNGDGTFLPGQHYVLGDEIYMSAAGDFDKDGDLDLATHTDDGFLFVMDGLPKGRFGAPLGYASGGKTSAVATSDFNEDGSPDLLAINTDSNDAVVWLNQGDGFFGAPTSYSGLSKPTAVALGDFDRDGDIDFAAANSTVDTAAMFLGRGDGTFQILAAFPTGGSPRGLTTADVNGDTVLDLIAANSNGTVAVLMGRGDGTFKPVQLYAAGVEPRAVIAGDFNRDGAADLAVANAGGQVSVLWNNGAGIFMTVNYVFASNSIATADFDGDGWLDLAAVNFGPVALLINATDSPPLPIGGGPRIDARSIIASDQEPATIWPLSSELNVDQLDYPEAEQPANGKPRTKPIVRIIRAAAKQSDKPHDERFMNWNI